MFRSAAILFALAMTAVTATPPKPASGCAADPRHAGARAIVELGSTGAVRPHTAAADQQKPAAGDDDDPRQVVERFFDAYRARDVDRLAGLFATDGVFEDPIFRQRQQGRDGIRQMAIEMRAAFSDVTIELHSLIASGDRVATEGTIAGVVTRRDGIRRNIKVRGASFFVVRNGKIHKLTDYFDVQTFNEQVRAGA